MADSNQNEDWLRQHVIEVACALNAEGLSHGTSGNVSVRWGEGMLITPSGLRYDELLPEDVVFVAGDGAPDPEGLEPSSEWRFHLAAYGVQPEVGAVVHCHSPNATALACVHRPIPPFHYMVAAAGGHDIPLAPYATFGGKQLAENVASALKSRFACLMANHGQIACGATLEQAFDLAREIESLATQYIAALAAGEPRLIDRAEMDVVIEKFKTYGQQSRKKEL